MKNETAIVWYRRDLRIKDHLGLREAAASSQFVVPAYFPSQWQGSHSWTGANRQQFLCESLASLDGNLRTIGGRLVVRDMPLLQGLRELILETKASLLTFQKDIDPFGAGIEKDVYALCAELGVRVYAYHDVSLHSPEEIRTGEGMPYRVYTPYSKQWLAKEKPAVVAACGKIQTPVGIASDALPTIARWGLSDPAPQRLLGGEKAARSRMKHALESIVSGYRDHRDIPSEAGTSRLSQDLRWGLLSIRELYAKVCEVEKKLPPAQRDGCITFRKELAWREFYFAILWHFPEVLEWEFNPQWRGLPWSDSAEHWDAWCQGRTGFPIVDAGMRELLATGHMHNRVRMITAMFLTKDLHIDWRMGESWFMRHLLDGEIASNNGGWQWSAGTGADAAPYFRIQNPWSQTARFDPDGKYIKRWVPELAQVAAIKLLSPPSDGRPLVAGYPMPIVDHAKERDNTLAIFQAHKQQFR